MKLIDMKINEYLDVLGSDAPAPGGGSASALAGAQGAALLLMVCRLTLGREKFSDFQEACEEAAGKARPLLEALTRAIDEDTEAFIMVSAAYKLPKETEEEKRFRIAAIQEGNISATQVPLKVMGLALAGLQAISALKGKTNPAAASDLGVAALNLHACLKGAWLNVEINLPGIKDADKAEDFREKARGILKDAERIAAGMEE